MNETSKRRPDWTLCVKEGEKWRAIGAAWNTERGNLYVRLDKGEQLEGSAMFFPWREKRESQYAARTWRRETMRPVDHPALKPAKPAPFTPVPPEDDACPDPEAPSWL